MPEESPKSKAPPAPRRPLSPWKAWWRRFRHHVYMGLFIVVFLLTYLAPSIIHIVPAGSAGVLFRTLEDGTDMSGAYSEGLQIVSPINTLTIYDCRVQEKVETVDVLSFNGLTISVTVSFRYKPVREELPLLHASIGPEYERKIVIPTVYSSIREIVGKYRPEELYTTHRITVQTEVIRNVKQELEGKHIDFETILIRAIRLPPLINAAIENKLRQQQEFQEYEYRISKERKEAERKVIEANGIQDFQNIVSKNLTRPYLQWKGIQSTLELAKSNNAKVVVIGGKGDGFGLPLIMGDMGTTAGVAPESEALSESPSAAPDDDSAETKALRVAEGEAGTTAKPAASGASGSTMDAAKVKPHSRRSE